MTRDPLDTALAHFMAGQLATAVGEMIDAGAKAGMGEVVAMTTIHHAAVQRAKAAMGPQATASWLREVADALDAPTAMSPPASTPSSAAPAILVGLTDIAAAIGLGRKEAAHLDRSRQLPLMRLCGTPIATPAALAEWRGIDWDAVRRAHKAGRA